MITPASDYVDFNSWDPIRLFQYMFYTGYTVYSSNHRSGWTQDYSQKWIFLVQNHNTEYCKYKHKSVNT